MSHRDPPSHVDTLLEKLMRAGWVSGTGTITRADGRVDRGVEWTKEGLTRSVAIAIMLHEVEIAGGRLTDQEILCFHRLIRDHALPSR